MKKIYLLIHLLGLSLFAWVQNEQPKPTIDYSYAYSKGKWRMPLQQNIRIGTYTTKNNDEKYSTETEFSLNLENAYFFTKNWAGWYDINVSLDKTKYEGADNEYTDNEWSVALGLMYGRSFKANKIYWNAQLGYELGGEKQEDKTNSNTTTDKMDYSKIRILTGLDIRSGNSNVFINPYIGYDIQNKDYENSSEDFNNFRFGARLVSVMSYREYSCDLKTNCSLSKNMYNKGRSFIGYTTDAMFGFGNYEIKYDNTPTSNYKGDYDQGHLNFDYNYFIIDNLALGLVTSYQYLKDKEKDSDYEENSHTFLIGPKITGHIPVDNCWRNFYAELAAVFGGSKDETKGTNFNYKTENNITSFWGGIGYNFVVFPNLSFTPTFQYLTAKANDKDSDDETKISGFNVRMGFKYLF